MDLHGPGRIGSGIPRADPSTIHVTPFAMLLFFVVLVVHFCGTKFLHDIRGIQWFHIQSWQKQNKSDLLTKTLVQGQRGSQVGEVPSLWYTTFKSSEA